MSRVEGAESPGILRQLLNRTVHPPGGVKERQVSRESEHGAGMKGALALRRESVAEALHATGFVTFQAGSAARMKVFLEHAPSRLGETALGVDSRTAAELATHMGAEVTGDVNQVLRILACVDPERVAMLLK